MIEHMIIGETYSDYLAAKRFLRNTKADIVFTIEHFDGVDTLTPVGTMLANTTNFITGFLIQNVGGIAGLWELQIPTTDNGSAGVLGGWLEPNTSQFIQNGMILGVYKSPCLLIHGFGAGKAWGSVIRFRENVQV